MHLPEKENSPLCHSWLSACVACLHVELVGTGNQYRQPESAVVPQHEYKYQCHGACTTEKVLRPRKKKRDT